MMAEIELTQKQYAEIITAIRDQELLTAQLEANRKRLDSIIRVLADINGIDDISNPELRENILIFNGANTTNNAK